MQQRATAKEEALDLESPHTLLSGLRLVQSIGSVCFLLFVSMYVSGDCKFHTQFSQKQHIVFRPLRHSVKQCYWSLFPLPSCISDMKVSLQQQSVWEISGEL